MTDDHFERMTQLLAEVISAMKERPDDAMLLMKEVYAEFQRLPAADQKLLNETFQLMAAEMDKQTKPH